MLFSTNLDMLNINLMIFFRLKKSLPVKPGKSQKRDVIAYIKMTKYVDIALSGLFFFKNLDNPQVFLENWRKRIYQKV